MTTIEPQHTTSQVSNGGIFISHVHEDKPVADALSLLLQDISAGQVTTFSSSSTSPEVGIPYGSEWFQWINSPLVRLTTSSQFSLLQVFGKPWILFEAGLGKAQGQDTVFGLAVGSTVAQASVGPFAVFRNSGTDQESLVRLCRQLISPSGLNPRDEILRQMVDTFIETVTALPQPEPQPPEDPQMAAVFQALEDLRFLVRDQPRNLRHRSRQTDRELEGLLDLVDEAHLPRQVRLELLADCADAIDLRALAILTRTMASSSRRRGQGVEVLQIAIDNMTFGNRADDRVAAHCIYLIQRELDLIRSSGRGVPSTISGPEDGDRSDAVNVTSDDATEASDPGEVGSDDATEPSDPVVEVGSDDASTSTDSITGSSAS